MSEIKTGSTMSTGAPAPSDRNSLTVGPGTSEEIGEKRTSFGADADNRPLAMVEMRKSYTG